MCGNKDEELQWVSPASTRWQESQVPVKSWEDLRERYDFFRKKQSKFIFRGQSAHGNLKTSLERAFVEFAVEGDDRRKLEKKLIRSFKRKAHHYLQDVPEHSDTLGWLALMQHYGAPTRLLDWTYSFWRAVHCVADKNTPKVEVWAMDANWFNGQTEAELRKSIGKQSEDCDKSRVLSALDHVNDEEDYKGEFANSRSEVVQFIMDCQALPPSVYNVTPFELNDRVIYQQATFVMPGDITKCFMQNLEPYGNECKDHLYRVVTELSQDERKKVIKELYNMNINEAVLFPGLDGFARSLRLRLAFL